MRSILSVVAAAAVSVALASCKEHAKPIKVSTNAPISPTLVARVVDSGSSAPAPHGRMPGPVLLLWSDHVVAISMAFPDATTTYRFARVDDETFQMISGSIESAVDRCGGRPLIGPDMSHFDCSTGGRSIAVPRGALENPKNWPGISCADPIKRVLDGVPKIPSDDTVPAEEQQRRLGTLPKAGLLTADAWRALE